MPTPLNDHLTPTDIRITFPDKKTQRTAARLIREFTGVRAFLRASRELYQERGLSMQYRGTERRSYFPTEKAWDAFVKFVELVQDSEPFASRSTLFDTHGAFVRGFADMLSDRLLPENASDLIAYLPDAFKEAVTSRYERTFYKLHGVTIKCDAFLRIGHCWLGTYGNVSFDGIHEEKEERTQTLLDSISNSFEAKSPIIAAGRNPGTSEHVKRESAYQCDLALSFLCVLLNLTYGSAFHKLWQIRRVDKPEFDVGSQCNFSILSSRDRTSPSQLGVSVTFREQSLDIDTEIVDRWHDTMGLGICNRLVTDPFSRNKDLVGRLINAILHFRLAAGQSTPEMQMSTLWICVESIFTMDTDHVLNANLPGLLATTITSMHRDYWPNSATTIDELKVAFAKYYGYRSRTLHHGKRGHVTPRNVQDFSLVVGCLIVDVIYMIDRGIQTGEDLSRRSQLFADRLDNAHGMKLEEGEKSASDVSSTGEPGTQTKAS